MQDDEDDEPMYEELKEAFRLYDTTGIYNKSHNSYLIELVLQSTIYK